MQDILIFRCAPHEGPGYLGDYFLHRDLPYQLIRIDRGDPIPTSIDGVSGIVLMGGPMSVNDPLPWIPKITHLVQKAVRADLPVLGHCLGGQLISKALGGVITKNPVKEIGWLPVRRVDNPGTESWLDGLPGEFEAFHWHGETFSLPQGATHLLASRDCAHQGFVIGKSLALQCHIEMTAEMVREWASISAAELTPTCATVQDADTMTSNLDDRITNLQTLADTFYDRWIEGLG